MQNTMQDKLRSETRPYFLWRSILFAAAALLMLSASLPNGPFASPVSAIFAGLAWMGAFVVAYWFSKPVLLAVFSRPKADRSLAIVKLFGLLGPMAYAAGSVQMLDKDLANLLITLCGGAFFLIYLSGALIALRRPAVAAFTLRMVEEHRAKKSAQSHRLG